MGEMWSTNQQEKEKPAEPRAIKTISQGRFKGKRGDKQKNEKAQI